MSGSHAHVPQWVQDAVFYQIFPDRFQSSGHNAHGMVFSRWGTTPTGSNYMGGDLNGITAHMPYLSELGITAIYLTPIFSSASNHRYHTDDYYNVDPLLGGNAALRELLDTAHAAGIKVILDGVFNHCGRGFYPFHHLVENGADSPYRHWFYVESLPLAPYDENKPAGYASWWDIRALPKLNVSHPPVRQFLLDVARYWIEFGIDGWRLDVPNEISDHDFWREFRQVVKDANPEAYIVGEIWEDATPWLDGTQFDAVMNYPVRTLATGFFATRTTSAMDFSAGLESEVARYRPDHTIAQYNVLDSHDTERFLTLAEGRVERLKLAMFFLMTYVGAPSIYYGDEIGLMGGKDPLNRVCFPWNRDAWNEELREWVRNCISLRQSFASLRRGSLVMLHARDSSRTVAFARIHGRETLVVVLNASDNDAAIDMLLSPLNIEDEMLLHDQLSTRSYTVQNQSVRSVKVPANGSALLMVSRR
ncbi:MAG: hypothetical protein RI985_1029 [Chloroflexota bacterium]|jgi:cyclomaltodextrinase